jgi:hypothetical protein
VIVRVPKSDSSTYSGRKHCTSHDVMSFDDFDLKFTYVLAGSKGFANDARILADNPSILDGSNISDGKLYLGDTR